MAKRDPTAAARATLTPGPKRAQVEDETSHTRLVHYWSIIRPQAWKIGAAVAASLLVTFVVSSRIQPVYESTASISLGRTATPSAAGGEAAQYAAAQLEIVVADPVLRPVAVKYNLLERENQLEGLTPEQATAVKESPIALKGLKVSQPPHAYVIQISYQSTSPQLSADAANAIAQSYIEELHRLQTASVLKASGLESTQLEESKARMERSSEAVARLKSERDAGNREGKSHNTEQRLRQLNAEHTNAQADLLKKKAAYNSVKSGSSEAARALGQAEGLQRLEERINEAEERSAEIKASKGQSDPDYKREQLKLQDLRQQHQGLSLDTAGRAEAEYNRAVASGRLIEQELAQTKADFDRLNAHSVEYQKLQQEADTDRKLYEGLEAKVREAEIGAGTQGNTVVSDPARPSNTPVFPNLPLNLGEAGVLACFLASGAAVLLGSLDKTIRDPEEVRRLFGTELIGTLPVVKDARSLAAAPWAHGPRMSPAAARPGNQAERSMSSFEEAIRMLRNSILLSDVDRGLRSILVTSASPGEGKSTVAIHVAAAHAEQGQKTLLIDADLRRATLDKKIGISGSRLGLSDFLLGEKDWQEAVVEIPDLPNLHFLPAGAPSSRASNLIGAGIADMLDEAGRVYDLIILDAPPILGAMEPLHLAIAADGVVVIATARGANRREIKTAVSTLSRLQANLIGIVLNRLSPGAGSGNKNSDGPPLPASASRIPPTRTRATATPDSGMHIAEPTVPGGIVPRGAVAGFKNPVAPPPPPAAPTQAPSSLRAAPRNTPPRAREPEPAGPDPPPAVSRGAAILPQIPLSQLTAHHSHRPFRPCLPDYRESPIVLWEQLRGRVLRDQSPELEAPGDPAGYRPLRELLAGYFGEVRGIRCQPDQIFVTGGLAESIQIAGMVVLPPEGFVGMEEPGHVPAKAAFLASGARLVPLLVDEEGAIPPHSRRKNPPHLLYVTPAHQFPLGVPMTLPRRLGFLDFVHETGATILEDDYDREFWYRGSPPESLFSLDSSSSTLYAASFGKFLFPSLRLSCLVVPESRVEMFLKARAVAGASNSTIDQATLALFLREGHFTAHMRHLRAVCEHRLATLAGVFASEFSGVFEMEETCAGLQTIAWLGRGWDEDEVASAGLAAGLEITPLGAYGHTALLRPGVVLGFATWNEEEIRRAATRLALALRAKRAFSAAAPSGS